jgi:hypothetical protein
MLRHAAHTGNQYMQPRYQHKSSLVINRCRPARGPRSAALGWLEFREINSRRVSASRELNPRRPLAAPRTGARVFESDGSGGSPPGVPWHPGHAGAGQRSRGRGRARTCPFVPSQMIQNGIIKRGGPGAVYTAHEPPSPSVGEEGFEPSHPFGHTDLNRARLPFRHSPRAGRLRLARPSECSCPG